jgi:hypothetical protein
MIQGNFFEMIISVLNQSTLAYRNYLASGKTFRFALELKLHNSKALELLTDNKQLMPEDLQEDVQSLITHYTEWSQKWEKLAAEKEHQPGEVFVFANDITFPRKAAQKLEAAYTKR